MLKAQKGSTEGKIFEELFKKQAQRSGLFAKKNHLTALYCGKGHTKIVKSELDFTLINQAGRVAYVDCKSFGSDYFTFSEINPDQIKRSYVYNEWNVPSGFVVWLRECNRVIYLTGQDIQRSGPGSRFEADSGILLGRYERFELHKIYNAG